MSTSERSRMFRTLIICGLIFSSGCRSDVAQQDAITLARSKGADIRISIKGDAQRVDLRRCTWDDELRFAVRQLTAVESLLACPTFSDVDLELLDSMSSLKNLDLSRTQVTASGLDQLSRLRQLEFLSLNGMTLTDADMAVVSKLRQLKSISMVDAKISEESLKAFAQNNPECIIAR